MKPTIHRGTVAIGAFVIVSGLLICCIAFWVNKGSKPDVYPPGMVESYCEIDSINYYANHGEVEIQPDSLWTNPEITKETLKP